MKVYIKGINNFFKQSSDEFQTIKTLKFMYFEVGSYFSCP